jgi:hypothetical protein
MKCTLLSRLAILFPLVLLLSGWKLERLSGSSSVKVEREGLIQTLVVDEDIKKFDILYTGKGTKALLTEGGSRLWVGENSVLRVHQLKNSQNNDILKIDSGKIRVQVSPTEAKHWKFETRSAVSGVRGTEFFILSTESKESICVLEGTVESELKGKNPEQFVVPAGKGVQIQDGQAPIMINNSNFTVSQWVAETSLDDELGYIPVAYSSSQKIHDLGPKVQATIEADLFYCDLFNPDFNRSTDDSNRNCIRGHIYPSVEFKSTPSFRLRPRVSYLSTNQDSTFDTVPQLVSQKHAILTVSEAYGQMPLLAGRISLGWQRLNVADGHLIADARFTNEPLTHLAIRSVQTWHNHDVDFFLSRGVEGQRPTDGLFPHSLALLSSKIFEDRGEVYALRIDSIDALDSIRSEIHHTNLGFIFKDRTKKYDFKISGVFQSGTLKPSPSSSTVSVNDTLLDLEVGFYSTSRTRIFLRALDADAKFSSVAPAPYSLGLFPGFYQIGNVKQARTGFDYRFDESRHLSFEYIGTWDHEKDGVVRWRTANSSTSFIAEEADVIFRHKWDDFLSYQLGGYAISPHGYSSNSDPVFGLQALSIWSL